MAYSADDFARRPDVSRETFEGFQAWENLLSIWNKKINIVQPDSVSQFWARHALDSWQLTAFIPNGVKTALDLGSGGGFPGLAIALALKARAAAAAPLSGQNLISLAEVHLVESNGKKCAFLRAVIRELSLPAKVQSVRAEELAPQPYDLITARAFAPLPRLFDYALPFWGPSTRAILPKGRNADEEIAQARGQFSFSLDRAPSLTDPEAQILIVSDLSPLS